MVSTAALLGLVLVATATDVQTHKIYNWTTYPGILAALALSALAELLGRAGASEWWCGVVSRISLSESLYGLLLCGGLMVVCFAVLKIGGGDVKLLAMLGAFMGPERGLEALLWTFVLGAGLALLVLIWRVGPLRLVAQVFRHLVWILRLGQWVPLTEAERKELQPPLFLAPSALAAVIIVQFFNSFEGVW